VDLQRAVLNGLWNAVNEQYLYPDFNGVDWPAAKEHYFALIDAGLSDQGFYLAMDELIASLGDEHSYLENPQEKIAAEAAIAGNQGIAGIGVFAIPVPKRQLSVIITVFPGSGAEEEGLHSKDSILAVDGTPILEQPREVTITRRAIVGGIPTPRELLVSPDGKRSGYILIPTFLDANIANQVGDALQEFGLLDGLILDDRLNGGGLRSTMNATLAYFMDGLAGRFVTRSAERDLVIDSQDIGGSLELPLVVLVGENTVSYGEVFSGILQDQSRAYIIGGTTLGNVEALSPYDMEDGSRLWLAHESFRPLNNPDSNWEKTGIIPDLEVTTDWDLYPVETDPAIQAALDYFDSQLD
jgi:C-terminal processing protease CtpA/Prc